MTPEFLKWFADTVPLTAKMARAGEADAAASRSIAWSGWQASRAALVIELPAYRAIRLTPMPDENGRYNEAIDACREALTDVGLTVKP